jgi:hypothetical protein
VWTGDDRNATQRAACASSRSVIAKPKMTEHVAGDGLRSAIALTCAAAIAAFRAARLAIALYGLGHAIGVPWAVIAAIALFALRLRLPIRIGAFLTTVLLWRWPWIAALALAAPRLFLVLPGLVATALARLRYRRARWPQPMARASER